MKRFRFPLEPVRGWRDGQARAEEMKLGHLRDEQARAERSLDELLAGASAEAGHVLEGGQADAVALQTLDAYRRHARREADKLATEIAGCRDRVASQRDRVIEARRQARLLDRLRERQLEKWKSGADRELEQLAGELFLARLVARPR